MVYIMLCTATMILDSPAEFILSRHRRPVSVYAKPVYSGSLVVTAKDLESSRPGSNPEWRPIYYEASITAGLTRAAEPSFLRGSTLGTRAAEYKGCNWSMQIDWWLQPRAVFGHTFSGIIWHYATEIKSIQLHDSIYLKTGKQFADRKSIAKTKYEIVNTSLFVRWGLWSEDQCSTLWFSRILYIQIDFCRVAHTIKHRGQIYIYSNCIWWHPCSEVLGQKVVSTTVL